MHAMRVATLVVMPRRTTDLQVRGIPVEVRELDRMDWNTWIAELRKLPPIDLKRVSAAEIVREPRKEDDADDARLWP